MGVAPPSETNPAPEMVSEGASLEELARATEPDDRERLRSSLVEDLVTAHRLIGKKPGG